MAEAQLTTFNVNINLIDEGGGTDANTIVDKLTAKIQELTGMKVQSIGAVLSIKTPSSSAQRTFLNLQSVEEGGKQTVKIVDVPKEAQAPPASP